MFDADKFLAARQPWMLRIGGREFAAQPVSVAAILDFQSAAQAAAGDERSAARAVATLLRALFPARWAYLWHGDPVRLLMRAGGPAVTAALTDFFDHLARTASPGPEPTPSPTPLSVPRSPRNPSPVEAIAVPV